MDDSRSSNEAIAAHREAFYKVLVDRDKDKDASHILIKSKSTYENIISFLTGPIPTDKNI
jgi:hypothetical protein